MHAGKVIFINIAQNPYVAQVRNREWIGRAQARHARGICDLLIGDHAGNWGANIYNRCRMVHAATENAKTLGGVLYVHLSLVLDIFRCLEIVQKDGSLVVEKLGALEL